MWEFNPAYRCGLVDKRGLFKGLVEEAMRSVGVLTLRSRLSSFDDDGQRSNYVEPPETEASFRTTSSYDFLNLILYDFGDIMGRLESLERPACPRRVLDRDFLRSCEETLTMIDDELFSCSMDNHAATAGLRLHWDDDSTMDNVSTILSETPLSTSSCDGDQDNLVDHHDDRDNLVDHQDDEDDVQSVSSDVMEWRRQIFQSAFDEFDFDVMDFRGQENEVKNPFDETTGWL
ncbi:hypothetical protein GE061_013488 [Apolygus lucorum]|uniref:Uncharacterized protein n=1 Tax=Apolygus lucorum TaxID=248454 RepID=A0A6A4K0V3_APOLU|nr:hypothetical protein GE061_013488 [Apolygus lucorum]